MALTLEQMQEQRKILKEDKAGMKKERLRQVVGGFNKLFSGAGRVRRTFARNLPTQQQGGQMAKRFARALYPQIPATAVATPTELKRMQELSRLERYGRRGGTGSRGRPRGPSGKYVINGRLVDVFTYRKIMARQRAYSKLLQAQQMGTGQVTAPPMPQMQVQQYPQQMPQQYQQVQMPMQYPQQYPQMQPQRREIVPVFRSSGGHPYPPVDNRPLMSNPNGAYYEDTNFFNGQRVVRKRLQPEAWLR